jgi:hypothetical protein
MSTPSGKPFDPFDLSPYAPRRARERVAPDQPSVGNDDPVVESHDSDDGDGVAADLSPADLSPYAPRAAQRSSADAEHSAEPDGGDQARPQSQT